MKIQFEEENGCHFAIAFEAVFNGQVCDELWFAEIEPKGNNFNVRWNNNYSNPIECSTLEIAKEYVLENAFRNTPQIVGNRYDL